MRFYIKIFALLSGLLSAITFLIGTYLDDKNPFIGIVWRASAISGFIAFLIERLLGRLEEKDAAILQLDLENAKRDAANAKSQSEEIKAELAEANRRAAEADEQLKMRADEAEKAIAAANARAEADRLARITVEQELAKAKTAIAPRRLIPAHQKELADAIKQFTGQSVVVKSALGDSDGKQLGWDFVAACRSGGWHCPDGQVIYSVFSDNPVGVCILINPQDASPSSKVVEASKILVSVMDILGFSEKKNNVFTDNLVKQGDIWIRIGSKFPITP